MSRRVNFPGNHEARVHREGPRTTLAQLLAFWLIVYVEQVTAAGDVHLTF